MPGSKVQFLDRPNGANGNGAAQPVSAPATADRFDEDVPF